MGGKALFRRLEREVSASFTDEGMVHRGGCEGAAPPESRPHKIVNVAVGLIDPQLRHILTKHGNSLTFPKLISRVRRLCVDVLLEMSSVRD